MNRFIDFIRRRHFANITQHLSYVHRCEFQEFMAALQAALQATPDNQKAQATALLMNASIGHVLRDAYRDYLAFIDQYECSLHYCDSLQKSCIFTINLKERRPQGRDFQFKFTRLKAAQ